MVSLLPQTNEEKLENTREPALLCPSSLHLERPFRESLSTRGAALETERDRSSLYLNCNFRVKSGPLGPTRLQPLLRSFRHRDHGVMVGMGEWPGRSRGDSAASFYFFIIIIININIITEVFHVQS